MFRDFLRRQQFAVAILCLLACLCCWTISSPVGSSPDEPFHIGNIWCSGSSSSSCSIITKNLDGTEKVAIPYIVDTCFNSGITKSAVCIKGEKPATQELVIDRGLGSSTYYKIMHTLVSQNGERSVLFIRLTNSVLFLLIFSTLLYLSRSKLRRAVFFAIALTLVPLGLFLISSLNPSSWTITAVSTNWAFIWLALMNSQTKKTRVTSLVLWLFTLFIGIASRKDAAFFLLATNLVVFFLFHKQWWRASRAKFIIPLCIFLIMVCARFAFNSMGMFFTFSTIGNYYVDVSAMNRTIFNIIHAVEIPLGAWGGDFGAGGIKSFDIAPPPMVSLIGVLLFSFTLKQSLQGWSRRQIIAVVASLAIIFVPILQVLNRWGFLVGDMVTARYVLPAMPFVIGVSIAASSHNQERLISRKSCFVTGSLISLSHSVTLFLVLQRYVSGSSGFFKPINTQGGWWWEGVPSPNLIWLIGTVTFTTAITIGFSQLTQKSTDQTSPIFAM